MSLLNPLCISSFWYNLCTDEIKHFEAFKITINAVFNDSPWLCHRPPVCQTIEMCEEWETVEQWSCTFSSSPCVCFDWDCDNACEDFSALIDLLLSVLPLLWQSSRLTAAEISRKILKLPLQLPFLFFVFTRGSLSLHARWVGGRDFIFNFNHWSH